MEIILTKIQPKIIFRAIEEKIEIVKYAEQYSIHKASEKYDVDRQSVRTLKNQLPNLIAMTKKFSKMIMHPEKKRNRRYRWKEK